MMLKLLCLVIIALFSVNILKAQNTEKSSFIIMSSHGYSRSDFATNGSGHMNTFLYSPRKLWAYGVDLDLSQGRSKDIQKKMFNASLLPSVYLFPLNRTKHQIYLGVGVGIGFTNITNLKKDGGLNSYLFSEKEYVHVAFGANVGYNYKFKKHWMIGVRTYYEYSYFSSIMGLISLGYRF